MVSSGFLYNGNYFQEENIPDSLHIPCSRSCENCFATITVDLVEEQEAAQKRSGDRAKKGSVSFQIGRKAGAI